MASFSDSATEALFHGSRSAAVRRIPNQIRAAALRKLDILDAATTLSETSRLSITIERYPCFPVYAFQLIPELSSSKNISSLWD